MLEGVLEGALEGARGCLLEGARGCLRVCSRVLARGCLRVCLNILSRGVRGVYGLLECAHCMVHAMPRSYRSLPCQGVAVTCALTVHVTLTCAHKSKNSLVQLLIAPLLVYHSQYQAQTPRRAARRVKDQPSLELLAVRPMQQSVAVTDGRTGRR